MNDQYVSLLQQQGMSEKEALVYLCTLELGSAPASSIARKAAIKRVTAYAILKDLETRQIASSIEKKGVSYFQVIDPLRLLAKMKEKYELFEKQIPELLALVHTYSNKPRIQYFEGLAGVKEMYEDLLSSQVPISAFLGLSVLDPELENYLYEDFLPRRIANKIRAKVLISADQRSEQYRKIDKKSLKETRVIKDPGFNVTTEINLYGPNKVAIALFSSDEMSAMVITSKRLYESLLSIFNILRTGAHGKK